MQIIITLALLFIPLYVYLKLNDKWQKRAKVTFWLTIWIYPVLYLVYASNPDNFLWVLSFLGITILITGISFFWEGGFKVRGSGDDDPSGNNNINTKFYDHM